MVLLFIRNQLTLVYMFVIAEMCHGLLECHRLKVLLHVLKSELESIKFYASRNNFPKYVTCNIMKKAINKTTSDDGSNQSIKTQ